MMMNNLVKFKNGLWSLVYFWNQCNNELWLNRWCKFLKLYSYDLECIDYFLKI